MHLGHFLLALSRFTASLQPMHQPNPHDLSSRALLPDLIRCAALIGIVIINVGAFSWPLELAYTQAPSSLFDISVEAVTTTLFMTKAYSLFSLMFGVGLAYQIRSAENQGKSPSWRHYRRIAGLIILGGLHASFLFLGDVLIVYAIIGLFFYGFIKLEASTLIKIGIGLIFFQIILLLATSGIIALRENAPPSEDIASIEDETLENIAAAFAAFGEGTFMQATAFRASHIGLIAATVMFQGFNILGYFLLGFALAKKGFINTPAAPFWGMCRRLAFPIGLLGSALGAYVKMSAPAPFSSSGMLGYSILTAFAPFLALGYAGWIAKYAAGPAGPLKSFLARAGTATLSAYILQSVCLSLIFSAYGLDLYGKFGAATSTAIGLGVGVFSLMAVSLWRTRFARGPLEMLLRRWTYLG